MPGKWKATVLASSPKGWFGKSTAKERTLKDALMSALEKMPDESEGVKGWDCNRYTVVFEKEE